MVLTKITVMELEQIDRTGDVTYAVKLPFSVDTVFEIFIENEKLTFLALLDTEKESDFYFAVIPAEIEFRLIGAHKIIGSFKIVDENKIQFFTVIQFFNAMKNEFLAA